MDIAASMSATVRRYTASRLFPVNEDADKEFSIKSWFDIPPPLARSGNLQGTEIGLTRHQLNFSAFSVQKRRWHSSLHRPYRFFIVLLGEIPYPSHPPPCCLPE